jgi:hypothetical protein
MRIRTRLILALGVSGIASLAQAQVPAGASLPAAPEVVSALRASYLKAETDLETIANRIDQQAQLKATLRETLQRVRDRATELDALLASAELTTTRRDRNGQLQLAVVLAARAGFDRATARDTVNYVILRMAELRRDLSAISPPGTSADSTAVAQAFSKLQSIHRSVDATIRAIRCWLGDCS